VRHVCESALHAHNTRANIASGCWRVERVVVYGAASLPPDGCCCCCCCSRQYLAADAAKYRVMYVRTSPAGHAAPRRAAPPRRFTRTPRNICFDRPTSASAQRFQLRGGDIMSGTSRTHACAEPRPRGSRRVQTSPPECTRWPSSLSKIWLKSAQEFGTRSPLRKYTRRTAGPGL